MKKKILMLAIAACLVVLSIAGSSLAYFTDTEAATNVFTSGNGVNIELNYTAVNGKSFPGQSYDGATISLADGSEDAYVGAIITMNKKDLMSVVVNLAESTIEYDDDSDNCTIYVVFEQELTAETNETATIFSGIQIPAEWGTNEMNAFNGMNITVTAYAVQTVGFNDAATALKTAFADAWKDYSPT